MEKLEKYQYFWIENSIFKINSYDLDKKYQNEIITTRWKMLADNMLMFHILIIFTRKIGVDIACIFGNSLHKN